jgi:hypothetical protein
VGVVATAARLGRAPVTPHQPTHLEPLCKDVCQRIHLHGAPPQLCQPPLITLQGVALELTQRLLAAAAQAQAIHGQHLCGERGGVRVPQGV